jgi:CheY-like chemotaxis protein
MSHRPLQVLVVEDQDLWREQFFGESLQDLGFAVFPASTKDEALALLDQHSFDLAVIDINLTEVPGNTDGIDVTSYIESQGINCPIIFVSGSEEGLRSGGEYHDLVFAEIRKDSFNLDEFINQVKAATDRAAC